MKGEGKLDHSTVFERLLLRLQNLNNQARSGRSKTLDSKAILQAIEANPMNSTQRVSGELSISQPSIVHHLYHLSKNICSCGIGLHVTKILQNF